MRTSDEEALELHRKYGSDDQIVGHCMTVAKVTEILAKELEAKGKVLDLEACRRAALLHDIGRNRIQTVRHGLEGSQMLRAEGLDDIVCNIVLRHVGAGISSDEAKTLGLPDLDYIPLTLEEVVVCFSDKMVDGRRVRPFEMEVERFRRKGHDVQRLQALKQRVAEELGADPETLIFDKIKESE